MAISGTIPVTGPIAPTVETDVYSTHDATYGRGGLRTVADNTERNAISEERRAEGMVVGVIATGLYWKLKTAPWAYDDTDWDVFFDMSTSWTLDGNANGAEKYFGTNDNYDVPFVANGNEVLRLGADGSLSSTNGYWINGRKAIGTDYDTNFSVALWMSGAAPHFPDFGTGTKYIYRFK